MGFGKIRKKIRRKFRINRIYTEMLEIYILIFKCTFVLLSFYLSRLILLVRKYKSSLQDSRIKYTTFIKFNQI